MEQKSIDDDVRVSEEEIEFGLFVREFYTPKKTLEVPVQEIPGYERFSGLPEDVKQRIAAEQIKRIRDEMTSCKVCLYDAPTGHL